MMIETYKFEYRPMQDIDDKWYVERTKKDLSGGPVRNTLGRPTTFLGSGWESREGAERHMLKLVKNKNVRDEERVKQLKERLNE